MCELAAHLFDRAMQTCQEEREAAFMASCSFVRAMEGERLLRRPRSTRRAATP
jgi:hypothetical protein